MHRPALGALILLSSFAALAQQAVSPPPPPPPQQSADAPAEDEGGRVRWGVNAQLGAFFPATSVVFGLEGRVGYQFSPLFAVYGDIGGVGGFGIGASASSSGASATVSLTSFWHLGVNAELTLGDHFYVAAGPHFASAAWGTITATGGTSGGSGSLGAAYGPMPALDVRLGFMTGAKRPGGGRRGFSIGLDAMTLFAFNGITATASGNDMGGGASIERRGLVVGIAPTLTLGFDSM